MTNIRVHGQLGKIFGSFFKVRLGRINDFVAAIDAIREGFRKKLMDLHKEGYSYTHHIDRDGTIHILPSILGAGKNALMIIAIIIIIIVIIIVTIFTCGAGASLAGPAGSAGGAAGGAGAAAAGTAGGLATGAGIGTGILGSGLTAAGFAATTALSIGVSLLQAAMSIKTGSSAGVFGAVGGSASAIDANGKSYIFGGNSNRQTQGGLVAIGYGRMRMSTKIINTSIKSYNPNERFEEVSSSKIVQPSLSPND